MNVRVITEKNVCERVLKFFSQVINRTQQITSCTDSEVSYFSFPVIQTSGREQWQRLWMLIRPRTMEKDQVRRWRKERKDLK